MNFLAHIYLASPNEDWMIGNFIADAVKGKSYQLYEKKIAEGILMHRFIDHFTDTHPLVKDCTSLLRNDLKKFAPVALDVYFDYFLAKNWQQYHQQTLADFAQNAYQLFNCNFEKLPIRNQQLLPYMVKQNWLLNYATISGIEKTLNGMAQRTTHGQILQGGEKHLIYFEEQLQINFKLFFKDLTKEIEQYKKAI